MSNFREYEPFEEHGFRYQPMDSLQLTAVLLDIASRVAAGDSFEGSFEYLMPGPLDYDGDAEFLVKASYRIGNLGGQGGIRLIPHPSA